MKKFYVFLAVFLCMGLLVMGCNAEESKNKNRLSFQYEQTVAVTNSLTDWHDEVYIYFGCTIVYLDGEVYRVLDINSNDIPSPNGLPFHYGNTEVLKALGEPIWTNFPEEISNQA